MHTFGSICLKKLFVRKKIFKIKCRKTPKKWSEFLMKHKSNMYYSYFLFLTLSLVATWIAGKYVEEGWLYTCSNSSRTFESRDHNPFHFPDELGFCLILVDPYVASIRCSNGCPSLCEGNFKYT